MSSNSRDYYHTSSQSAHDRSLPPIRDVVGAELEQRGRPNPYTFGDVRGALPTPSDAGLHASHGYSSRGDSRGPTLPPIQHSGYPSSRGAAYPSPAQTSGRYSEQFSATQQRYGHSGGHHTHSREDPSHTYGVLRTSGTSGTLCDATPPQAGRPHGILRQTAATVQIYDQDPDKKHKCDYCGKKFDRPSSLEVHLRTHTGSQPFACEWPGCDRTFSVRSNMLRHWRSHEKNSSQHQGDEGDDDNDSREQYFHTSSSSGQHSASQYYSSSRRK